MADNNEVSQWEPGIYQIETTDEIMGGVGGVSNRPNVELTNRSARIKTVLDENGIYVIAGGHSFHGQNIDVTASAFEGTVSDGDVVAWNNGNLRYEKVIAPNQPSGIADVSKGQVVSGGMIILSGLSGSVAGDPIYLSSSVSGGLTLTPSTVVIGKMLWKTASSIGVISLTTSTGGAAHSALYDDEANKHFTEASIKHSAINNDEMSIHTSSDFTIGHIILNVVGNGPPPNYLHCNGALLSTTTYAALYSGHPLSIGTRFGGGGGTFYLPDFRGRVPRGYDQSSGRDPDRASRYTDRAGGITGDNPGSMQEDMFASHLHTPQASYPNFFTLTGNNVGEHGNDYGAFNYTGYSGGSETRMKNFSVLWAIRYQ